MAMSTIVSMKVVERKAMVGREVGRACARSVSWEARYGEQRAYGEETKLHASELGGHAVREQAELPSRRGGSGGWAVRRRRSRSCRVAGLVARLYLLERV